MDSGIETMKTFFESWLQQIEAKSLDGDVEMEDEGEGHDEAELKALQACLEKAQPQIEANPWLQSLIASF